MIAKHPHIATDWQAVAIFFAGFITEEHPGYASLILQVIADNSKFTMPAEPAERITS